MPKTDRAELYTNLITLITKIADYIFRKEEKLQKGLGKVMGGQVLELESERLRREGKTEGKAEGAKIAILDLLEDYEPLPDSLKEFIFNENSSDTLRRWLKLAAKATSLEDFKSKIGA